MITPYKRDCKVIQETYWKIFLSDGSSSFHCNSIVNIDIQRNENK